MPTLKTILIVFASAVLLSSCYKEPSVPAGQMDEFFNVKNGEFVMPVRVAGKTTSTTAIIIVHGGPGNSALQMRIASGIKDLEKTFKVVYYEQRGSGISQGNVKPEDIYIDKYAEDLDAIVEFTRQIAGCKSIFILGHSWGGGLSSYYLTDVNRQAKIKGYIAVDAAYNFPWALELGRDFVISYANHQIAVDSSISYWTNALKFYDANPVLDETTFFEHGQYVSRAKGALYTKNLSVSDPGYPALKLEMYLENFAYINKNMKLPSGENIFRAFRNDPNMGNIILPTIILWGRQDGLTPLPMADSMYKLISTPVFNKRLKKDFTLSAHSPYLEEGPKFLNYVKDFVLDYE